MYVILQSLQADHDCNYIRTYVHVNTTDAFFDFDLTGSYSQCYLLHRHHVVASYLVCFGELPSWKQ